MPCLEWIEQFRRIISPLAATHEIIELQKSYANLYITIDVILIYGLSNLPVLIPNSINCFISVDNFSNLHELNCKKIRVLKLTVQGVYLGLHINYSGCTHRTASTLSEVQHRTVRFLKGMIPFKKNLSVSTVRIEYTLSRLTAQIIYISFDYRPAHGVF